MIITLTKDSLETIKERRERLSDAVHWAKNDYHYSRKRGIEQRLKRRHSPGLLARLFGARPLHQNEVEALANYWTENGRMEPQFTDGNDRYRYAVHKDQYESKRDRLDFFDRTIAKMTEHHASVVSVAESEYNNLMVEPI